MHTPDQATGIERAEQAALPYLNFVWTACVHALVMMPRRRMTYFAALLTFTPVIIPLSLMLPDDLWFDPSGRDVFVRVVQFFYVTALCPLLAIFFGGMLIGEEVKLNTFPYILTRPIPRSAWVAGKFLGYFIGVSVLVLVSLFLTFVACTFLSEFPINGENIRLFLHFSGAIVMGIAGYGAVMMMVGALFRWPTVVGLVLLFPWQRFAVMLPGYTDFLTIDKYMSALLPEVPGMPSLLDRLMEQLQVEKFIIPVTPLEAFFTLIGIIIGFLALTTFVTRWREYNTANAAG